MIRMDLIAIALSVTLMSCNDQTSKQKGESNKIPANPQTSVKVDKKYDDKGNLIRYDSSYSYYYSNVKDDENLSDSIFNSFRNALGNIYFFSRDPYFNDLFFEDSLLKYDFYRKDFFLNRFQNNMRRMDNLFLGMDSLKNSFFSKQFMLPVPLIAPKK
jgi:hypothetical protein